MAQAGLTQQALRALNIPVSSADAELSSSVARSVNWCVLADSLSEE